MIRRFLRWARPRRRWPFLVLFALLAGLAGVLLWAEYHLRAARRALERRAYPEARAHVDRYLRVWPRSATAHLLAARSARAAGNFDEAERLLAACERLGLERETLGLEEALLDAQRGTLSPAGEAVLWYRVEQEHPETPHILEALALGCIYTNRLGGAMTCLDRWAAYSPGDAQALYLRGLVWQGMGDPDKAAEDYRQAVRRNPGHAQARARLAAYLIYAGKYAEAAGHFQDLLGQDPGDGNALLGLAVCRRLQGRAGEARCLLQDLLDREDPPVAALLERARLAQEAADFPEAEKWYRKALDRDPSEKEASYGLAQTLHALKRPREAEVYETRTARIERDLKRLAQLHEAIAKAPDDPELAYEAGRICLRNGQKGEARRWFRRTLRLAPEHQGARRGLEHIREE